MKRIGLSILVLLLLTTNLVCAGEERKIAVAAEGKTAASRVSDVAARCPYFLIFDGAGRLLEVMDNPFKGATRRAGTSVVPFLDQKGVSLVVAGTFGKNMIRAMREKGIESMEFQGSAEEALKKILEAKK